MTSPGSAAEAGALLPLRSGDGSFSLHSAAFGEAFHAERGAVREAVETFVQPSALGRYDAGRRLRVVELCVGTGTNTLALLQACADHGLTLDWWGLELDPRPLQLALASDDFRRPWGAGRLQELEALATSGRLLWGDARRSLAGGLPGDLRGRVDLVWHDAFSPRRCPQLWSFEVLQQLAALLAPDGRLVTYCAAAAVRAGLQLAGLQLASIPCSDPERWCHGTVASPVELEHDPGLRALTPMEREHLASRAGEPYRDPDGRGEAPALLAARDLAQRQHPGISTGAWRRRWGVGTGGATAAPQ
ncbi:MAG: tRNA (5-methylaminomethyl-2-thiouridine)(34)-methyltransferase MnmD [Cyanobacteriota bacterium]